MRRVLKAAGVAAALAATFGLGVATASSARPAEAPTNACHEYIDQSERLIDYMADALGYAEDAMLAVSRLDADAIDTSTERVNRLTPKIEAMTPKLQAAKAECRGKS